MNDIIAQALVEDLTLLARYRAINAEIKKLTEEKDALKLTIVQDRLNGGYGTLVDANGVIVCENKKIIRKMFETEKFKQEHTPLYQSYLKETETSAFYVKA